MTLPVAARRLLGVGPRDTVTVIIDRDTRGVRVVRDQADFDSVFGAVPALATPLTDRQMKAIAQQDQAARVISELHHP
jgi:bifunctional DNA-binding transcriptional regulator/antitoxin component of YhaV-PrlF toxin-antitoxin module